MTDEAEENLLTRAQEIITGIQNGMITGIICVCFLKDNHVAIQVSGEQNLLIRLGALQVASDAIKVHQSQIQIAQQPPHWGPGGNA